MESRQQHHPLALFFLAAGIVVMAIGVTGTMADAAPGNQKGQGPLPCAPGVDPAGEDGCATPAGSRGKGCEHGKGLNKKGETGKAGHQGADCAPPVVVQEPPTTTTAADEDDVTPTTVADVQADVESEVPEGDAPADVLGEVVVAESETARAAPEALAFTGSALWPSFLAFGLGMVLAGAGLRRYGGVAPSL